MIEAFERHLNTMDFNRKFENAKTNNERVVVAKEFLEKNGYEVKEITALRDIDRREDDLVFNQYSLSNNLKVMEQKFGYNALELTVTQKINRSHEQMRDMHLGLNPIDDWVKRDLEEQMFSHIRKKSYMKYTQFLSAEGSTSVHRMQLKVCES